MTEEPLAAGTFDRRWREDVAVAAMALQPFGLLLGASFALRGLSPRQLDGADPLIRLLGAAGVPGIVLAGFVLGAAWWSAVRPGPEAVRRGLRQGAAAVGVVTLGMAFARILIGPSLPAFLPPEESARPGLVGGLAAGVLEEAVFRLMALPALLVACASVRSLTRRFLVASLAVGVIFAISHEMGPGAERFALAHFVARLVFPGFLMSIGCRWPGVTFVVSGHCAAHVLLPVFFA